MVDETAPTLISQEISVMIAHKSPILSIITPYYNTGPIFYETVETMVSQTLQQWEWIIVNDGSTAQGALDVLESLRNGNDPRIRIVDQKNQGLSSARNTGIATSCAPLLFFLDSDDLIETTTLEKLVWLLHSDPRLAFATTWCQAFGAQHFRWSRGFETRSQFLFKNTVTASTIVRRSVFQAIGAFNEQRRGGLEDYEFWLHCAAHGYWGHDIPEYLLFIRYKTAIQYQGYAWPNRDDPQHFRTFQQEMRSRYPRLYREGVPSLPPIAPDVPITHELPFENQQPEQEKHLLLILSHYKAHDQKLDRLLHNLVNNGYRHTICTETAETPPHNNRLQPNIPTFTLKHFLQPKDYPRFIRYLIQSRQFDAVVIYESQLGYGILPYLHAFCPDTQLADYVTRTNCEITSTQAACLDIRLADSQQVYDDLLTRTKRPEHLAMVSDNWLDMSSAGTKRQLCLVNREQAIDAAEQTIKHLYDQNHVSRLSISSGRDYAWQLAKERLMLAFFPLAQTLLQVRGTIVQHPLWQIMGPTWRGIRQRATSRSLNNE